MTNGICNAEVCVYNNGSSSISNFNNTFVAGAVADCSCAFNICTSCGDYPSMSNVIVNTEYAIMGTVATMTIDGATTAFDAYISNFNGSNGHINFYTMNSTKQKMFYSIELPGVRTWYNIINFNASGPLVFLVYSDIVFYINISAEDPTVIKNISIPTTFNDGTTAYIS